MNFITPELNAVLNGTSAVLLVCGFILIQSGKWRAHAAMMISATAVSSVFLACYLLYHYRAGEHKVWNSLAPGWLKAVYYVILFPHLLLAMAMLPMIFLTLWRAWRREWARHRKIAVPTFFIWLYVSVTGVIVYFLLYHTSLAG